MIPDPVAEIKRIRHELGAEMDFDGWSAPRRRGRQKPECFRRAARRLLKQKRKQLSPEQRKTMSVALTYFENNQDHMHYNEYLAAGYPIGSGVAEGACRHLVKDRMELTGMRWERKGAQSMLYLRAIYLNGEWDKFVSYRIENEQATLYGSGTVYEQLGEHAQAA